MREGKIIGIGVMAALVAGLGLSVPATVYADDSTGQAGSGTLIGQGKDGINSIEVDGKELIKGDPVSTNPSSGLLSATSPRRTGRSSRRCPSMVVSCRGYRI